MGHRKSLEIRDSENAYWCWTSLRRRVEPEASFWLWFAVCHESCHHAHWISIGEIH